jgi:hypothetical protein
MDPECLKSMIGPVMGALIGASIAGVLNYLIFVRIAAQEKRKELCVQMHSSWLSTEMWQIRQAAWRELARNSGESGEVDLERLEKDKPEMYYHIRAICQFIESVNVLLSGPKLINRELAKQLFWNDFKEWLARLDKARFPQAAQIHYNKHVKVARLTFREDNSASPDGSALNQPLQQTAAA